MQNKRYLEIIKGLKEAIADARGKCERSVHRIMEVKNAKNGNRKNAKGAKIH